MSLWGPSSGTDSSGALRHVTKDQAERVLVDGKEGSIVACIHSIKGFICPSHCTEDDCAVRRVYANSGDRYDSGRRGWKNWRRAREEIGMLAGVNDHHEVRYQHGIYRQVSELLCYNFR